MKVTIFPLGKVTVYVHIEKGVKVTRLFFGNDEVRTIAEPV